MSDKSSHTTNETPLMQRALDLAISALGTTWPNPAVGCVIAAGDGAIISSGATGRGGRPHAETLAIDNAAPTRLSGATAYVSLEPCNHFGETPPCSLALIESGVGRVVVATLDPDPRVNGTGVARLRQHGVEVNVGLLQQRADEINAGFYSRVRRGRPWLCQLDIDSSSPDPLLGVDHCDALLVSSADLERLPASVSLAVCVASEQLPPRLPEGPLVWTCGHEASAQIPLQRAADGRINYEALLGLLGSRGLTRLGVDRRFADIGLLRRAGLLDAG
ncbi:MAG: bifunctional diaminohydroxyphosphoribosylaminopyrimidine deaminase/5-amino-6-(5-phosphoribosylamino)uracil reductase RibD [Deltaproteobacteria bacterium]|nr:bifunctional diaminohydroxyphosphoribosylaminopyrimidine deaminase/5-amino-6-(5-phosphoribosylamino)uracil reductase RibD [Deltaproteobacteria bacterium]